MNNHVSETPKGSWETVRFPSKGDSRGELVVVEENRELPFAIKRIYYLIKTKEGVRRGFHAHRNLDQVLLAISGSCRVLVDDSYRREEYLLNDCQNGLRIKNLVWREMFDFSPDCVLLVLASEIYNEDDYIRNYDEFLRTVRGSV